MKNRKYNFITKIQELYKKKGLEDKILDGIVSLMVGQGLIQDEFLHSDGVWRAYEEKQEEKK